MTYSIQGSSEPGVAENAGVFGYLWMERNSRTPWGFLVTVAHLITSVWIRGEKLCGHEENQPLSKGRGQTHKPWGLNHRVNAPSCWNPCFIATHSSPLTSNGALLVLVELALHKAQHQTGLAHRRLAEQHQFELADLVARSRAIGARRSTASCHGAWGVLRRARRLTQGGDGVRGTGDGRGTGTRSGKLGWAGEPGRASPRGRQGSPRGLKWIQKNSQPLWYPRVTSSAFSTSKYKQSSHSITRRDSGVPMCRRVSLRASLSIQAIEPRVSRLTLHWNILG